MFHALKLSRGTRFLKEIQRKSGRMVYPSAPGLSRRALEVGAGAFDEYYFGFKFFWLQNSLASNFFAFKILWLQIFKASNLFGLKFSFFKFSFFKFLWYRVVIELPPQWRQSGGMVALGGMAAFWRHSEVMDRRG